MLDTSIRKSYGVGSLNIAVTITVLLSIECCPSIVIMHSVLIGIGRGLITVLGLSRIGGSCGNYWSRIGWSYGNYWNRMSRNFFSRIG